MEGVLNSGFVDAKYKLAPSSTPLLLFRPAPPMAAIDRFLHGRVSPQPCPNNFSLLPQERITTPTINVPSSTLEGNFVHHFSPSSSRDDVDGGGGTVANEALPTVHGMKVGNTKRSSKRMKGHIIKGQWTDNEDSKLVELVKKYGTRKWSLIAMNLVGRAGKQCRERWHNHLRPDIKKDSWDENEERMLVEAHLQFGNRWAEIARRIPGRSENSIKNYWNATKRRRISKRKNKNKNKRSVVSDQSRRSSLLLEYIKSLEEGIINLNNFIHQSPNNGDNQDHFDPIFEGFNAANMAVVEAYVAPPTPNSGSTTFSGDPPSGGQLYEEYNLLESSSNEYYDEYSSVPLNIDDSCQDEAVFMQNLFNNNSNSNSNSSQETVADSTKTFSLSLDDFENRQLGTSNAANQVAAATYYGHQNNNVTNYSDWMVYSLLEGGLYDDMMIGDSEPCDQMMAVDEGYGYGSSGELKDMDLYELVSANSHQFSQGSCCSSNYSRF